MPYGLPIRRVVLLTPATSYRTADFLRAAERLRTEVIIGTDQTLVAAAFAPGRFLELNFRDREACVRQIVALASAKPLAAIVGVDESTTLVAAAAARALGLTHNSVEAISICHHKYAFRVALKEAGLPSPKFQFVPISDLKAAAQRTDYPCILKPLSLSASRGVIRAESPAGFVAVGKRIARILASVEGLPEALADALLCEGFIAGREAVLEGILRDGELAVLALFDKPDPLDGPFFEETIYVTPSTLGQTAQIAMANTVSKACRAVGLCTGPVHAELRVNDQGVWLIELAARTIGGRCAQSLRFGTDTRLEELVLRQALGDDLPTLEREPLASGVMMLPIRKAGTVHRITGIEAASAVPGITGVHIEVRPGEPLVPLPEGDRYLGFLFARGPAPADVEQALRAAEGQLSVELESD